MGLTFATLGVDVQGVPAQEPPHEMVADRLLRVQFTATANGNGTVRITGYVYNDNGRPVDDVQLRITEVDFSGYEVATYVKPLLGAVPASGHAYFDVAVPDNGESYRVAIDSWN
jgi:hypothetical protein